MARRVGLYAVGVTIGLASGLLTAWLCHPSMPAGLISQRLYEGELALYDYRMAYAPFPGRSPDIVLVTIDEESFSQPELSGWPWPRRHHATVIGTLAAGGAKLIGIDMILSGTSSDETPPEDVDPFFWEPPLSEDDRRLVKALEEAGNVVLAMEVVSEAVAGDETAGELIVANFPHPDFEDAALGLAAANLSKDIDGTARRYLTSVTHQDEQFPTLGVAVAALSRGVEPTALAERVLAAAHSSHPALPDRDYLVNYRGPIGRGFERIPYYRLLDDDFEPEVAGKIVLIGASARALQDLYDTPVSMRGVPGTSQGYAEMAGVEIIANAADTVLRGRYVLPVPVWQTVLVTLALSLLMAAATVWLRPLKALPLALLPLMALAVVLTFEVMWRRGMWVPLMPVALGLTLTYVLETVHLELTAEREERRIRQAWSMRVSPEVLRVILSNPGMTKVGGSHVEGTVFFSDLRDFTSFCHSCPPEDVVEQVNTYLTACTEIIRNHGGTVHKFIGDGVMAVFGDPVPQEDHADRALAASVEIQRRMAQLREAAGEGDWPMHVRIGLHSGELVAGDIGSENMLEYTVMGDTVSIASRLEALNKELGTQILMSEDTAALLDSATAVRTLGEVEVRGRPEPLEVYTVEAEP
ncbi:MAG: adenylate/guanylate cyclase domain-containing protein [Armatimonadota bacterium]|nr:adenylate/guanylate cyclase domain-containing protein [Armatimonadota bacterium]